MFKKLLGVAGLGLDVASKYGQYEIGRDSLRLQKRQLDMQQQLQDHYIGYLGRPVGEDIKATLDVISPHSTEFERLGVAGSGAASYPSAYTGAVGRSADAAGNQASQYQATGNQAFGNLAQLFQAERTSKRQAAATVAAAAAPYGPNAMMSIFRGAEGEDVKSMKSTSEIELIKVRAAVDARLKEIDIKDRQTAISYRQQRADEYSRRIAAARNVADLLGADQRAGFISREVISIFASVLGVSRGKWIAEEALKEAEKEYYPDGQPFDSVWAEFMFHLGKRMLRTVEPGEDIPNPIGKLPAGKRGMKDE